MNQGADVIVSDVNVISKVVFIALAVFCARALAGDLAQPALESLRTLLPHSQPAAGSSGTPAARPARSATAATAHGKPAAAEAAGAQTPVETIRVREGETLWDVARRADPANPARALVRLLELNRLPPDARPEAGAELRA